MKIATDLEQSKKLDEILPIESADMHYISFRQKDDTIVWTLEIGKPSKFDIPAWSLSALLEQVPYEVSVEDEEDEDGDYYQEWQLEFGKENDDEYYMFYRNTVSDLIVEGSEMSTDWLLDACVEELLFLKEKDLL